MTAIGSFKAPASTKGVDWAIAYARAGMPVFPCNAQKKPLTEHGVKDAVTDEAQVRAWWGKWPAADIGWAVPADVVILDLDVHTGADGLRDFIACIGVSPDEIETPKASTPRGGLHMVFAANGVTYEALAKLF